MRDVSGTKKFGSKASEIEKNARCMYDDFKIIIKQQFTHANKASLFD
jgi:hypothetical protein